MYESMQIITKQAISNYANAVENNDPIFFSEDDAANAGLKDIIAPSNFLGQYQVFRNPEVKVPKGGVHTKQKMLLLKPIFKGDYIYSKTESIKMKDGKGRSLLIYKTTFTNQDNEVVCVGEMTNLLPIEK